MDGWTDGWTDGWMDMVILIYFVIEYPYRQLVTSIVNHMIECFVFITTMTIAIV